MDHALDALVEAIGKHGGELTESKRKQVYNTLQSLSWSVESPYDAMQRVLYSSIQLPLIRAGIDLKLFEQLSASPSPLSSKQIAESAGASELTVDRICRYLAARGPIVEAGPHLWKANDLTKTLTVPGWAGAVTHSSDFVATLWPCLPGCLRERNYGDIANPFDTVFNEARDTKDSLFVWMQSQPQLIAAFMGFMQVQRAGQPNCFDIYPIAEKAKDLGPEQPFFVDIGGSAGHQASAVREKLPDLPNKIINEDLEHQIAHAVPRPGVEHVAQNFFEPQKIKGSRIYYMRNIVHDWPDDQVVQILTNTREAFGPDSILLIDDMVLPEEKVPWQASQLDLSMMLGLAAQERSIEQWKALIARAGLKIVSIHEYTEGLKDSVVECVAA